MLATGSVLTVSWALRLRLNLCPYACVCAWQLTGDSLPDLLVLYFNGSLVIYKNSTTAPFATLAVVRCRAFRARACLRVLYVCGSVWVCVSVSVCGAVDFCFARFVTVGDACILCCVRDPLSPHPSPP